MGRKGEKTNPAIMICCTSREASNRLAASLTRSGMHLRRYPGSPLSSCDLPLEPSLVPRPLFDNRYQPRDPKTCTVNRIAPKDSDPGPGGASGPRMGRRLEFIVSSATGPRVRHATGGLIVRIGDELHQITSLDPLGDATGPSSVPRSHCDAEECEYESVPGAEDSAYEQIISSEKSLLLQAGSGQGETAKPQAQHPPAHGGICSPLGMADGGTGRTLMCKQQEGSSMTPARTEPTLARHQDNDKAHYYTLVKLSELESSEASNVVLRGDGHIPPKLEALGIAAVGLEPARVWEQQMGELG